MVTDNVARIARMALRTGQLVAIGTGHIRSRNFSMRSKVTDQVVWVAMVAVRTRAY